MPRINRVTMFKIPDPADQQKLLAGYEVLAQNHKKDGKPYILYLCAGAVHTDEERAQGYTIVSKTEFATLEDMRFYDKGCAAHDALRVIAKDLTITAPPLTVWFEGEPLKV